MRRKRLTTAVFAFAVSITAVASFCVLLSRGVFLPASPALESTLGQSLYAATGHLAVRELPYRRSRSHPPPPESVLIPEWEALVFLPATSKAPYGPLSCLFRDGTASPARFAGIVDSSGFSAFRCILPPSARRLRPLYSPRLVPTAAHLGESSGSGPSPPEMIRWTRLVYEAIATANDVIVLGKGINTRAGVNRPAADIRCVYYYPAAPAATIAAAAASSSAQEVFRCPHPPPEALSRARAPLRISLAIGADSHPIPSLATYTPPRAQAHDGGTVKARSLICACTMVHNVAKFLREWVVYHAAVGVERFFLYDNGSDDDLGAAVRRLEESGFNVSTRFWPWPKTQEAGFSHCAAVHQAACEWMAFLDVDEFVFSPHWAEADRPDRTMLGSLVAVGPQVGQVSMGCREFGPSGLRAHPKDGITQGYTCRTRAEQRHKSFVRLDTVDRSLMNSVHHFWLKDGFRTKKVGWARVNHYKYQAWEEFKVKFLRRVSAYVADWTNTANPGSKDRTPGLGFKAVEPDGWAQMFCEVDDSLLRETARRWFGKVGPQGGYKMLWEEE